MPLNNQLFENHLQNHSAKMDLQDGSFKYKVIKYTFLIYEICKNWDKEINAFKISQYPGKSTAFYS